MARIIRLVCMTLFAVVLIFVSGMLPASGKGMPDTESESEDPAGILKHAGGEAESGTVGRPVGETVPGSGIQSESNADSGTGKQSESSEGTGTETQSESGPAFGTETQSESEPAFGTETQPESGPPSETEKQTEKIPASESETEEAKWPRGLYLVRIYDVAVRIPEGGRVYDGTDRIDIEYKSQIVRAADSADGTGEEDKAAWKDEEVPQYQVEGSAHLDRPDAGERRVVCSFSLRTDYPENVTLDEASVSPDLSVTVQKAVLSVRIPDGEKMYGDPADIEHVHFEGDGTVRVSGFVRDSSGTEIVPQGFESPQIDVNPAVLERWSPIYDTSAETPDSETRVKEYLHALILRHYPDGRVTGNPTGNYVFCDNPEDERYAGGSVTVTRAPAERGADYVLRGDKGAYADGSDGSVIVRSSSSLRADPVPGHGYNTGAKLADIQSDGSFSFRLEMRSPDGRLEADSLEEKVRYRADANAPEADIRVIGASSSGGLLFSASSASISISVPDDDISGLDLIQYRILSGPVESDAVRAAMSGSPGLTSGSEWRQAGKNERVDLSGNGIYAVETRTSDKVGNTSLSRSSAVVIDTEKPGIEITGVEDGSANASDVIVKAQCHDPSFLPGSLKAQLSADFGGVRPKIRISDSLPDGAVLSMDDFPRQREADAVYHLSVTASDRAGNTAGKEISFSVNRFGSSYSLSGETSAMLKEFYHARPFDITFLETNLDKVGEARILLRSGDRLSELTAGSGMAVSESRSQNGFSQYSYTVPSANFSKDGTYEVMLLTTDRAGNSSDSSAQRLPVRFAVDSTAPECLVTGIRPEGRYKEKELTAVIEIRDNLALESAETYVDSKLVHRMKDKELRERGGIVKLTLSGRENWQTVQVHAADKAGNEFWTQEIPVYISQENPESAEKYRKRRLSAQQIDQIRREIERLRGIFVKKGWLPGKPAAEGPGIVRNLYRAQSRKDYQLSPGIAEPGQSDTASMKETGVNQRRYRILAVFIVMCSALLAAAGIIMYRRKCR